MDEQIELPANYNELDLSDRLDAYAVALKSPRFEALVAEIRT